MLDNLKRHYARKNFSNKKAKKSLSKACDIITGAILSENPLRFYDEGSRLSKCNNYLHYCSAAYSEGNISKKELYSLAKECLLKSARELYLAHKDYDAYGGILLENSHFNPPLAKTGLEGPCLTREQISLFVYALKNGGISSDELHQMNFLAKSPCKDSLETFILGYPTRNYASDLVQHIVSNQQLLLLI